MSPISEHPSRLTNPGALCFQSPGVALSQGISETLCRAEAFKKLVPLLTELVGPHWLLGALIHMVACLQNQVSSEELIVEWSKQKHSLHNYACASQENVSKSGFSQGFL